jgi:hypothetical protein
MKKSIIVVSLFVATAVGSAVAHAELGLPIDMAQTPSTDLIQRDLVAAPADMTTAPDLATEPADMAETSDGGPDLSYPLVKAPREDPSGCSIGALGVADGGAGGLALIGALLGIGLVRRRRRLP